MRKRHITLYLSLETLELIEQFKTYYRTKSAVVEAALRALEMLHERGGYVEKEYVVKGVKH